MFIFTSIPRQTSATASARIAKKSIILLKSTSFARAKPLPQISVMSTGTDRDR